MSRPKGRPAAAHWSQAETQRLIAAWNAGRNLRLAVAEFPGRSVGGLFTQIGMLIRAGVVMPRERAVPVNGPGIRVAGCDNETIHDALMLQEGHRKMAERLAGLRFEDTRVVSHGRGQPLRVTADMFMSGAGSSAAVCEASGGRYR